MNKDDAKTLRENRVKLVRNLIITEGLLDCLMQYRVITESMMETIQAEPTRMGKAGRLLDVLPRRGPEAFDLFIQALVETSQDFLAVELSPVRAQRKIDEKKIRDEKERLKLQAYTGGFSFPVAESSNGPPQGQPVSPQPSSGAERMDQTTAPTQSSNAATQPPARQVQPAQPSAEQRGEPMDTTPISGPIQATDTAGSNTASSKQETRSISSTDSTHNVRTMDNSQSAATSQPSTDQHSEDMLTSAQTLIKKFIDWMEAPVDDDSSKAGGGDKKPEVKCFPKCTPYLNSDINKLISSQQVKKGRFILLVDSDLVDNIAHDNLEALFKDKLGYTEYKDIELRDVSQRDGKGGKAKYIETYLEKECTEIKSDADCDGLIVMMITTAEEDLTKEQDRRNLVINWINLFNKNRLPNLDDKPKVFLFHFATVPEEGFDETDQGQPTAFNNSAQLNISSRKWNTNELPNSLAWIFVQAFLETKGRTTLKNVLDMMCEFYKDKGVQKYYEGTVHPLNLLSPQLSLTHGMDN